MKGVCCLCLVPRTSQPGSKESKRRQEPTKNTRGGIYKEHYFDAMPATSSNNLDQDDEINYGGNSNLLSGDEKHNKRRTKNILDSNNRS